MYFGNKQPTELNTSYIVKSYIETEFVLNAMFVAQYYSYEFQLLPLQFSSFVNNLCFSNILTCTLFLYVEFVSLKSFF